MSYESDSVLPPRAGLIPAVTELLGLLGYERTLPSFFPWREGALAFYSWFERQHYRSFSGIYLVLYRQKRTEKQLRVYTRTNSWCSHWDLQQQIRTLQILRRHFGGQFTTDAGINRFWRERKAVLEEPEAGCYLAFERFHNSGVKAALYLAERRFAEGYYRRAPPWDEMNPRLLANNLLLPYLVASLEDYFKSVFIALLRYSDCKQAQLRSARLNAERLDLVSSGELSIEAAVAEGMSFQNIESICAHFKTLDPRLDLAGVLRRPYRRRQMSLYDSLRHLVARRHILIHRSEIDTDLEDEDIARNIDDLDTAVRRCHERIIGVHGWSGELHSPPGASAMSRLKRRSEETAKVISAYRKK